MTKQEIKDNAPSGATNYSYRTDTYYKDAERVYVWNGKDWFHSIYRTTEGMRYLEPL